jgi:hypothetical protein
MERDSHGWPICPNSGARCFLGRACEDRGACWLRDRAAQRRDEQRRRESAALLDRHGNDD